METSSQQSTVSLDSWTAGYPWRKGTQRKWHLLTAHTLAGHSTDCGNIRLIRWAAKPLLTLVSFSASSQAEVSLVVITALYAVQSILFFVSP